MTSSGSGKQEQTGIESLAPSESPDTGAYDHQSKTQHAIDHSRDYRPPKTTQGAFTVTT